jgi:hypothetical protein
MSEYPNGITLTQEQWNRLLALIPKLQQTKLATIVAGSYLTDEQALTAVALYPEFKAGISVKVGERYRDSVGDLYKVDQAHKTQDDWQPSTVPALFTKISIDEWPLFVQPTGAQDVYNIGDKIMFEGQHYISAIDNNSWSPAAYPAGWNLQI